MSRPRKEQGQRPALFAPETPIGMHLRVERVIRVMGDRVLYLVNNRNPRWFARKCWACGFKYSAPPAQACQYCAKPLTLQRFIMSARWDPRSTMMYQAFTYRRLRFATLAHPLALFQHRHQLLAIFPYNGEQILAGEPSPLSAQLLLSTAFQLCDTLEYLHSYGVVLKRLSPSNILLTSDGTAKLFDLEIEGLIDQALPPSERPDTPPKRDLASLARLLQGWVGLDDDGLRSFLDTVERGRYPSARALSSAISTYAYERTAAPTATPAGAATDAGVERQNNEDAWGWRALSAGNFAAAVADGMGGHSNGELASKCAINTVMQHLQLAFRGIPEPEEMEGAVLKAMQLANQRVQHLSSKRQKVGSTLTLMVIMDRVGVVCHVGDSRLYLLRKGRLTQVTEDHSMVAAMVAAGKIRPDQAKSHPKANVLLQHLGQQEAEPETYQLDFLAHDRLLLCTDGLWSEVDAPTLVDVMTKVKDPRQAARRLIRLANDRGGKDNVTALIVDIAPS